MRQGENGEQVCNLIIAANYFLHRSYKNISQQKFVLELEAGFRKGKKVASASPQKAANHRWGLRNLSSGQWA